MRVRTVGRGCGGDPREGGAETEDGLARCSPYPGVAADGPISADLDSIGGGAGRPPTVTAPGEAGWLSNLGAKPIARSGDGRRGLPKKETLDEGGPEGTGESGAGFLDEPPPARLAPDAGPTPGRDRGVGPDG